MAIQDSINSMIGTAGQAATIVTGVKKLKESTELQKAQNELEKIDINNKLDQLEGDLANEIRTKDISAPDGKIDESYMEEYLQGNIKAGEENYNQIFGELKDQRKLTNEAANKSALENTPTNNLAYGREVKKENKLVSDMDMANRATNVYKDKLTAMKTLRLKSNILSLKGGKK